MWFSRDFLRVDPDEEKAVVKIIKLPPLKYTVDSRYLDFDYLELPLISKRKSDPCVNIEI